MCSKVRTVIINFQTPDLLKTAVKSFRKHYPEAPLMIIDNGSKDSSKEAIQQLQYLAPSCTDTLLLETNAYHGPAMHKAMESIKEEYVFFLDSDTQTIKGGFLEKMQKSLEISDRTYAIGRKMKINRRGFPSEDGTTVIVPAYMMVKRALYPKFLRFEHHGFPVMKNFFDAQEKGFILESFPIEDFIDHSWRGTASRFGYGLGWRGRLDYLLNKVGL